MVSLACIALRCHCQLCYQIQEHFLVTYLYPLPKLLCILLSQGDFKPSLVRRCLLFFKRWFCIFLKYENVCFVSPFSLLIFLFLLPNAFLLLDAFHPKTIYSVLPMATNSPSLICMDFCIACSLEVMLSSLVAGVLSGYLGQPLVGLENLEPGVKGPEFPVQPQLPG